MAEHEKLDKGPIFLNFRFPYHHINVTKHDEQKQQIEHIFKHSNIQRTIFFQEDGYIISMHLIYVHILLRNKVILVGEPANKLIM